MNPVENLAVGLFCGIALGVIAGYIMGWSAGETSMMVVLQKQAKIHAKRILKLMEANHE